MLVYSNIDSICPNIESLDELGIPYNINGNIITIYLDRNNYTIISNEKGNDSLSYFIIRTYDYRIVASGNLEINNSEEFFCKEELRVFSKYTLLTYDYYRDSYDGCNNTIFYNERLLRESTKEKMEYKKV